MMRLIAIGRMKDRVERDLFDRYAGRLKPRLDMTELPEGRGSPVEIKRREAQSLLAALPDRAWVVALDEGGGVHNSLDFARTVRHWQEQARPLCFLIGGAEGLDGSIIERADAIFSLGPLTWPHMLVRILLAEQLYRAQAITSGHPYHRAGRPT